MTASPPSESPPRLRAPGAMRLEGDGAQAALRELGYREPEAALAALGAARAGVWYQQLGANDRERVEALLPTVLGAAARTPAPLPTLRQALDLVERMAPWSRYLVELGRQPAALERLVGLIGASPFLGQLLIARPALADELLPGRYVARAVTREALSSSLDETLRRCSDDQPSLLLALRNFKHSCVLQILALDLDGALGLDAVSGALSDLADLLLTAILARVAAAHGPLPLGILAYGKLGSREMSYASDTDIVFLHDDGPPEASEALARAASAVNHVLTTPTPAGVLYETDFRLRPYGESGLLVTSLSAFRDYQLNSAWTWEHQALTRARFIAGPPELGAAFARLRRDVLARARDRAALRDDVLAMRTRIRKSQRRVPGSQCFDVKHSAGGIIDVEFLAQYLVLREGQAHPALLDAGDNASVLAAAARLGLIPAPLAQASSAAFARYRLWMHRERLRGSEIVEVGLDEARPHRDAVLALWGLVFALGAQEEEHA